MDAAQLKHAASGKCLDVLGGTGNHPGRAAGAACVRPGLLPLLELRAQVPASLVLLLLLLLA
jgi:hypothetical protein